MAPAKANAQHADFVVVLPTPACAIVSTHRKYLEQEERSDDGDGNDSPMVPISPIDLHPVLCNISAAFLVSQDSSSPTKRLPAAVLNTDLHLEQLQQENFELKKLKESKAFREALRLMAEEDVVKVAQKKVNEMEQD
ncbi:hypothetical protein FRB96_002029 [Tulasnella sp. 330]|nr:hypothetical protein FRB96_002029 [Tulasnella sp. 330]